MALAIRFLWLMLVVSLATFPAASAEANMYRDAIAVEICHEGQSEIVYVDADGRQLPEKPLCDCAGCGYCTLVTAVPLSPTLHVTRPAALARSLVIYRFSALHSPRLILTGHARGPPILKG